MRFFEVFPVQIEKEAREILEGAEVEGVNKVLHGGFIRVRINCSRIISAAVLREAEEAVRMQLLKGAVNVRIENTSEYEYASVPEITVLQEETVEKQPENEMKPNYDSQAVGQTQGAIPKQAATIPAGAIPVYANAGGIPVYYTMTLVQDKQVLQRTDIDYMHRKPSVFEGIMSKFAFKKKSHKDH